MRFLTLFLSIAVSLLSAAEFRPELWHGERPLAGFLAMEGAPSPMLYLNSNYNQYGAGTIPFAVQPAGSYEITLDITAPAEEYAAVGFYLLRTDNSQQPIRERQNAVFGKFETITLKAISDKPVKGLMVKKMENRKAPTAAVGKIRIAVTPEEVLPAIAFAEGHAEQFGISALAVLPADRVEVEGKNGIGVGPERSRFAWSTLKLNRNMPAGNYEFTGEILYPSPEAAEIALYARCGSSHVAIGSTLHRRAGGVGKRSSSFVATEPFSEILVKKMTASHETSIALGDFTLTMRPEIRLSASCEVLRYPAPFGIRSASLEQEVAAAAASGDAAQIKAMIPPAERWLDSSALLQDAAAEFETLKRAARPLAIPVPEELPRQFDSLKQRMADRKLDGIETEIRNFKEKTAEFHRILNRTAGGEVLPDCGSNIFSWVRYFGGILGKDAPEYEEPTPYRIAGRGGIKLSFRSPGSGGVLESSWTTLRYLYDDAVYTFSVLTGVMAVDVKQPQVSARITGRTLFAERQSPDAFLLATDDNARLLVLSAAGIESLTAADRQLDIRLKQPGRIGLLFLDGNSSPGETAAFYLPILDRLPEQAVEIQRGKEVEQIILDRNGETAAFFPVPPLFEAGLAAPAPVKTGSTFRKTPEGRTILDGKAAAFRYSLPERKIRNIQGINIFDKTDNTAEQYRELREQGCQTVRLACGTATRWNEEKPEIMRDALVHNLKLIAETGLKAGIDLHNGWHPGKESGAFDSPEYIAEFTRRWALIIEWAAPYRESLAWYDLMNEPHIFRENRPVTPYWKLIETVLPELRKLDPGTPFLVEVANMANPVGARDWPERLPDGNVILGFHDYWPHMFTHQKVQDGGSPGMPDTSYPSFMPMITWETPSWRNNQEYWFYWDRWKVESVSYAVYHVLAATGITADCGELGVVGYASGARNSGKLWLADSIRRMKKMGVSYEIWGVNGGYVWNIPHFKEEVLRLWR